jgi:hypothetical protein
MNFQLSTFNSQLSSVGLHLCLVPLLVSDSAPKLEVGSWKSEVERCSPFFDSGVLLQNGR